MDHDVDLPGDAFDEQRRVEGVPADAVPFGATRLRVVETGFAALATTDEKRQGNYDDNVGGWKHMLEQLDAYVVGRVAV